ncbi:glycosyltransferase (plasmid) [Haloarcula sp. NS06]|uniref:glycosyltransferase n=1 Tax=Haloarcula sp. NS06 TaxID=3409688 RepID=UPI003DA77D62
MQNDVNTIFIFSPVDFDKVQRHTETYYLSEYCSKNFETHVATPSSQLSGVTNHHFHFDGIIGVVFLNLIFAPFWAWLFITEKPDVVYCYPEVITPALIGWVLTDTDVVFDIRAEPFEQREEFTSKKGQALPLLKRCLYSVDEVLFGWTLRRSDLVVTLSNDLAEKLSHNYRIDSGSIHILPLGVDVNKFEPQTRGHGAELSLVYLGTINEIRGLDKFIDAVERLDHEARSKLRFDLIGGGDDQYIAELRSRVDETLPNLTFEYHGYVDHEAVPRVAGRSDVAISLLPGLESFNVSSPAKIYEYQGLGLPVIATDIPAHRRILSDGEDSVIVDQDDPGSVSTAIEDLLSEPDRVSRLSDCARDNAMQHSWENRFSRLFDRIRTL